jgi:hypothetical protein
MAEREVTIRTVLEDAISKPLKKIGKSFAKVRKDVKSVSAALGPLNSQFTGLIGLVSAGFGASESLRLAKDQVKAERGLLNALNGRVLAAEKLFKLTSDIQSVTEVGDEALLPILTQLRRANVATADLPRTLQVVLDTATALNLEMGTVTRGVALGLNIGQAGELGEKISELRTLQAEGRLTTDILDVLEEKFGGAAAASAETDFGRLQQELNSLGDTGEEFGKVLVQLIIPALTQAREAAQRFVESLNSSSVKGIVAVLREILPFVTKVALGFVGLVGALLSIKAAVFVFAPLVTLLGSVVGLVGVLLVNLPLILVAFVSIKAVLAILPRLVKPLKAAFEGTFQSIKGIGTDLLEAFTAFGEGKIAFEDLWDFIVLTFDKFEGLFRANFLIPITVTFGLIKDSITGVWNFLLGGGKAVILNIADFSQKTFLKLVKFIVKLADTVFEPFRKAARATGVDIGGALAHHIPDEFLDLKPAIDKAGKQAEAGFDHIFDSFADRIEESKRLTKEALADTAEAEIQLSSFLSEALQKRLTARIAAIREETDAERDKGKVVISDILKARETINAAGVDVTSLLQNLDVEKVTKLLVEADSASKAALKSALESSVVDEFTKRNITAEEFLRLRQAIVEGPLKEEVDRLDTSILREEEIFDVIDAKRRVVKQTLDMVIRMQGTLASMGASEALIAENASERLRLTQEQNEFLFQQHESQDALLDLTERRRLKELELLESQRVSNDEQRAFIAASLEDAEAALTKLNDTQTRISAQRSSGSISEASALQQGASAVTEYTLKIEKLVKALDAIVTVNPKLRKEVEETKRTIDGFTVDLESDANDGFFASIGNGITDTTEGLSNLAKVGKAVGKQLVTSLASGLIDVFVEGKKTLNEFLGEFLQTIARMIIEMLIYKAIAASFSAIPGFSGGGKAQKKVFYGGKASSDGNVTRPFATSKWAMPLAFTAAMAMPAAAKPIKRASGGSVPGPSVRRDIIPAMLSPNEWVIQNAATSYYGDGIMAAINNRLIPKKLLMSMMGSPKAGHNVVSAGGNYATGGSATRSAASNVASNDDAQRPVQAIIVSDETTMKQMMTSGRRGFIEFIGENASEIRGQLGRS